MQDRLFGIIVYTILNYELENEQGNIVFQGLHKLNELYWPFFKDNAPAREALLEAWPRIMDWVEFFYDSICASPDKKKNPAKMKSLLMNTSRIFQLIYKFKDANTSIYTHDNTIRFTARMWLTSAEGYIDDALAAQLFSFCTEFLPPDMLDTQITSSTTTTIIEEVFVRVKRALDKKPFDFRAFDIQHEILVLLVKSKGYRDLVQRSDVTRMAIPVSMKAYTKVIDILKDGPPPQDGYAVIAGRLLRVPAYGCVNLWTMEQALRHGIFKAVISALPHCDHMDPDGRRSPVIMLNRVYPQWLPYPSVLARYTTERNRFASAEEGQIDRSGFENRTLVSTDKLYMETLATFELHETCGNRFTHCGNVRSFSTNTLRDS